MEELHVTPARIAPMHEKLSASRSLSAKAACLNAAASCWTGLCAESIAENFSKVRPISGNVQIAC